MLRRYFAVILVLTSCKATPAQLAEVRCDPATDLEDCNFDLVRPRRMTCAANGQWTPLQECFPPNTCVLSDPDDAGKRTSLCRLAPEQDDVAAPDDAAVFFDIAPKDVQPGDAKDVDASKMDAVDGAIAPDVPDVPAVDTITHQACFQAHSPLQLSNCLKSSTCIAAMNNAIDCVATCIEKQGSAGAQSCVVQCQNFLAADALAGVLASYGSSLLICASGCGDGVCEPTETPSTCPGDCKAPVTGSCQGSCGGHSPDGCYCDQLCAGKGDCCPDKVDVCGP